VGSLILGTQAVIYLICNTRYGGPFIEVLAGLHRQTGLAAALVFSGREDSQRSLRRIASKPLVWAKRKFDEHQLREQYGLPALIVENINNPEFLRRISSRDCAFIAGFNQILKHHTLAKFRFVINFHPSILPLYRGPVPSYWCLVNGENQSGFTMHRVTERIDDGEVLYQEVMPIADLESEAEIDQRIAKAGAIVFGRFLNDVVLRQGGWTPRRVDAFEVYRNHIAYLSFPKKAKVHG
jgi:methionyl-tRNA formyltransferase